MRHLILLHGALGSAQDFYLFQKHLCADNLKVHSFDFQGHGQGSPALAFDINGFSEELVAFTLKKNIIKPFVFGYSMGGYVALNTVLKNKAFFSGILTLGTKFNWTLEFTSKEVSKLNPETLLQKAPDFVELLLRKHGNSWKELLLLTSGMMLEIQKTHNNFMDGLSGITIPVWIGRGDKDKMVGLEESIMVQQIIPQSNYFVLPETSHAFEFVNYKILAAVLNSFMDKYDPNGAPAGDLRPIL